MGETCCGNGCFKLMEDRNHCGACDAAPCSTLCCNGACVPESMIDSNCGRCGRTCPDGCTCSAGTCRDNLGAECL
jgi:hypothetical protein